MEKRYILALDQGTTSSRAMVIDGAGNVVSIRQRPFKQIFPKPGWVEHSPTEIWSSQSGVATEALAAADLTERDIAAIGITNQRETTVLWDRDGGHYGQGAGLSVWVDGRRTHQQADLTPVKVDVGRPVEHELPHEVDDLANVEQQGYPLARASYTFPLDSPGCRATNPPSRSARQP